MGLIDKLTGYLSLQPNRLASLVKGEVTLVDSAGNEAGIDIQYDVNVDQTSLNGNYLIGNLLQLLMKTLLQFILVPLL